MKKILFILLICVIKLSAYQYVIKYLPQQTSTAKIIFYSDKEGNLQCYVDGNIDTNDMVLYSQLAHIKFQDTLGYIHENEFNSYYKNDLQFLNDLYLTSGFSNPFLNYLYNNKFFSSSNYKEYSDFQILYNSEGLAVASLVDGEYAGLYDNETIKTSGSLYDSKGNLVLYNGEDAPYYRRIFNFDIINSNLMQGAIIVGKFSLAFIITLIVLKSAFSLITKFPHDKAYEK